MAWHTTRCGTAWNLPAAGSLNATIISIDNGVGSGDEGNGSSRNIAAAAATAEVSTAAAAETTAQRSGQQTQVAVA